jgi:slime mold repeat-containing protein/PKD domain-containing protein/subtilase family protein/thrombospondin type 3 repeat protein
MNSFFSVAISRFLLVIPIVLMISAAPPLQAQGLRLFQGDSTSSVARSEKIDVPLRSMAQELRRQGITKSNARSRRASTLSNVLVRIDDSAALHAYIHVDSLNADVLNRLEGLGARIEISDVEAGIVQAWIPYDQLDTAADLPFVKRITVPSFGVSRLAPCASNPGNDCVTEGDSIHGADALRTLGYDGSGVKVGVISDGVDSLCDAVGAEELPNGVTVFGTCNDINPCLCSDGNEGVAMLEIVHDMAPGATLGFGAGLTSTLEFRSRIDDLMNTFHADVIVDDLGFFLEPYFEDGLVAQKVQEALNHGIVYASAAGNEAQVHYEGDYVDSGDGRGSHRIGPGNTVFNVSGSQVAVILQWANPFGASSDDYDLCFQSETPAQCAPFNVQQNGDDDPEEFGVFNCTGGCSLQVRKVSGSARRIELFVLQGTLSASDRVPAGSLFGHPAVPGVLAAAAVDAHDPGNDTVESYSSQGPSRIFFPSPETRNKPDLTGTDGVEVGGFGGFPSPFFGTSAAAPHIAAAAALLLGGLATADEVGGGLKSSAVDIGAAGFDFLSGAGRLDVFAAGKLLNDPPNSIIDTPAGNVSIHQGESVNFTGSCTDPNGTQAMTFLWTFGSGSGISDKTVEDPGSTPFNATGVFNVAFACRDNFGVEDPSPASLTVTVLPPDQDGDGVPDSTDNCPNLANANQADEDHDGVGDVCDNCPAVANPNQSDSDHDGTGDACESPLCAPGQCDDGNPCNGVEACNPNNGQCIPGTPITCDDGNACNGVETCNPANGQCLPGTPVNCSDGNACNGVETCNPANGQCVPGTPVSCDDGNACNGVETCNPSNGQCIPGTPVTCDDGNACNGTETCNPSNGQCIPGTPVTCDDGNACNGVETCNPSNGQCVAGTPVNCNDGNACNGTETCNPSNGQCIPGTPVTCGDGNPCNGVETCNPANGQCLPGTPVNCSDGNACNGTETCNPATGNCDPGVPLNCDDNNVCNGNETCDPVNGCQPGIPLNCRDGDVCNGAETCDPALGCQSGIALNCDDHDPCTVDSCDPVQGCRHDPLPDADNDGICDAQDTCPNDPDNDRDLDGICGDVDNCPDVPNADQADTDQDGIGDVCDPVNDSPTEPTGGGGSPPSTDSPNGGNGNGGNSGNGSGSEPPSGGCSLRP